MIELIRQWTGLGATVLAVLLLAVPLAALARMLRVYPNLPLLIAAIGLALFSIPILFWPDLAGVLTIANLAVLGVAAVDLLTLPRTSSFSVTRSAGRVASLGKTHDVELTIQHTASRPRTVRMRDDVPEPFRADPSEFTLRLPGRSRSTVRYQLRPAERGAFTLERVHLRARSRLGLWQRFFICDASTPIHVYPDMKQLSEFELLARTNRLSLMGLRRTRRIGQDNEFERLRDYTLDDNYKHIDWRATARRNRLTVKDFQANQSQRVIFLIDCGRMMASEASGASLLDHSLNAMLMLSYVALLRGDSVGMIVFSDEVHRFVPPGGGPSQMNRLLHAAFDQTPRLVESRYDRAFLYLASRCRKRALVILSTNVIDEVNSHQIEMYLGNLLGRHLPLGVLLRDHRLFDAADEGVAVAAGIDAAGVRDASDEDVHEGDSLFRGAAAADILTWRHQVLSDLESRGVLTLDVFPEKMTAPLVNQYLEVKARHLL
jgi:uncharacterized protein (DUF58 family)